MDLARIIGLIAAFFSIIIGIPTLISWIRKYYVVKRVNKWIKNSYKKVKDKTKFKKKNVPNQRIFERKK